MSPPARPDEMGEIEIRVRAGGGGGYEVELVASGGQDFPAGRIDSAGLEGWVESLEPLADGERLFRALFADSGLASAWAEVAGQFPRRRLKLRLDPEAAALHTLPWELLAEPRGGEPARPLAAAADTPFSRYLPSRARPQPPLLDRPFRLLVAIANPEGLPKRLPPIDVEAEQAALEAVFAEIPKGEIEVTFLDPPISPERLEAALREGFRALHLVAHGELDSEAPNGAEVEIQLANQEGEATAFTAQRFAEMFDRLAERPRLVFLACCSSAERSPRDAFLGLAPRLVAAGTGAVVAMQKAVLVPTARAFASTFYRRLLAHGQVDLATNEARSALLAGELPGAEVPVLFQRLRSGRLLGSRGEVQGKAPEIFWHPLRKDWKRGHLTAVLGPGIHHGLLPMPRQIARTLAANPSFGYPYRDDQNLPRVAQYLAAHRPDLPHEEVRELLARAFASHLPPGAPAQGACVSEVASAAGWGRLTESDEDEVHHQLASLGLPLYLTTNFDNLLTLALEAQGRGVRRFSLPWRAAQRGEPLPAPPPPPGPGESVVLHLFGTDDDPDSMVLTEDDTLDYMAAISRAERNLLPSFASEALTARSVLFLGYRLRDLDLRVLLRGVIAPLHTQKFPKSRSQIAVQFDPTASEEPGGEAARDFLEKYFGQNQIDVYWGSAPQFVADLVSRVEAGDNGRGDARN